MDNVETLVSIHNAVINGKPLTERIVTVSGDAVDVMSAARLRIKEAYEMAGDKSALWDAHKLADKEKQGEQNGG